MRCFLALTNQNNIVEKVHVFCGHLLPVHICFYLNIVHPCTMPILTSHSSVVLSMQSELVWRDLDSLLLRRSGIVLPLLVVSIFGLAYNPSRLFVGGVILSRYFLKLAF